MTSKTPEGDSSEREFLGAARLDKPWPEMTEAEQDAFVEAVYEQLSASMREKAQEPEA